MTGDSELVKPLVEPPVRPRVMPPVMSSVMSSVMSEDECPGRAQLLLDREAEMSSSDELYCLRFKYEVVHCVPGRLRVRIDELGSKPGFAESFVSALMDKEGAGIISVRVNTWCASAVIAYDEDRLTFRMMCGTLDAAEIDVRKANLPEKATRQQNWLTTVVETIEKWAPAYMQLGFGVAAFVSSIFAAPQVLTLALLSGSIAPILGRALRTAIEEHRMGVDGLDGLAALVMVLQRSYIAAGFMTALIGLGEFIRECTAQKCQKMMTDLLGLAGRSAWVVRGKKRVLIPADQVKVGDVVVVYPGEMVPVDGVVINGQAEVDQAKLTGESVPVEVSAGSHMFAATVVVEGKVYLRCDACGADTKAQLIVDLVSQAPIHETRTQNWAATLADKAVLPVLFLGIGCFALTRNVTRALSILIFDFATGIRIAAPTAVLASMERAARHGILIKSGGALERLASVDAVVFDKTGTLTAGEARITEIVSLNELAEHEMLQLAAAVEQRLHHPAARAIVMYAGHHGLKIPERAESSHMSGMGVQAIVEGRRVAVGSRRLMDACGVDMRRAEDQHKRIRSRGDSLSYVAVDGTIAGIIAYNDHLRPEAKGVIARLKSLGIKEVVMATGDAESPAHAVARALGIDRVLARAFPEHKTELVRELKAKGMTVAMVGDGINDSPALVHGDVAVSLRGGTDVARERSDVILTDDDLTRLPEAIEIARSAMGLVKQNFSVVAIPNGAGLVLAAAGLIGPATATLLNNGSAIVAGINSLRPLLLANVPALGEDTPSVTTT